MALQDSEQGRNGNGKRTIDSHPDLKKVTHNGVHRNGNGETVHLYQVRFTPADFGLPDRAFGSLQTHIELPQLLTPLERIRLVRQTKKDHAASLRGAIRPDYKSRY